MYVVLFHRYDRLGCNLICYIAQIVYAHYHGYCIKFIDNKYNHPKYPNSKFYQILLNYITKVLNINNDTTHCYNLGSADDEILYNINKYDLQLFCGFVTQSIKCDLLSYFHKHIYNDLDFEEINIFYNNDLTSYNFNNSIFCHLRLDDISHKTDYDGSIWSRYYKLLIENDKPCYNKFYEYVNNHSPLSKEKINIMLDDVKSNYPNDKIYMVTSPISDTDFNEYEIISNVDVDKDLFILCNSKKVIISRSMFALSSLFFSHPKEYCYAPSWGYFVTCGLNTKYDKNSLKYIY
jgi:hypothetical protein